MGVGEKPVAGPRHQPCHQQRRLVAVAVLEAVHQPARRVIETHGVIVKTVLSGGAAEKAGFAAGDEWLGVENIKPQSGWRIQRLDDLLLYAGTAKKVTALVSRDKRLVRLELTIPPLATTWRLTIKDVVKVDAWLAQ